MSEFPNQEYYTEIQIIEAAFGEGAMQCFVELDQLAKGLPKEQADVIKHFIDMLTTGLGTCFKVVEDVHKQELVGMRNICRNASMFLSEAKIAGDGVYSYSHRAYAYVQEILSTADAIPPTSPHEEDER